MNAARLSVLCAIGAALSLNVYAQEAIGTEVPQPVRTEAVISGTVYQDLNADGVRGDDEPGWEGIGVSNGVSIVLTNADGKYTLQPSPDAMELVYVLQPADCVLTPEMFVAIRDIEDFDAVDFGLVPQAKENGDITFAQVTDVHVGKPEDFDRFMSALQEVDNHPVRTAFTVATGDLVNRAGNLGQMITYAEVSKHSNRPWMHVMGNHDSDLRGSGMIAYRAFLGPDYYSFDRGDVHFLVRNAIFPSETQEAWIEQDLRLFGEGKTLVVLQHYPPTTEEKHEELHALGTRAVISGHWHSTRMTDYEGMLSINSPTFMMGAIDASPSGFRLITIDGDTVTTRFIPGETGRILALQAPAETLRVHAPLAGIWSAIHDSAHDVVAASYRIEGPETRSGLLNQDSPFGWSDEFNAITQTGTYQVRINAADHHGERFSVEHTVEILPATNAEPADLSPWPMFMGSAAHEGHTEGHLHTPLRLEWVAKTGASIDFGSPVTDGELVYVGVRDRDGWDGNGVAAFDAITGERAWFTSTEKAICHSVAVSGERVFVSEQAGRVLALDAGTGDVLWESELMNTFERWVYAAPTVVGDHVICGSSKYLACFDAETGDQHWLINPGGEFISSLSSPAVADGLVVMGGIWQDYDDSDGHSLAAFDLGTGDLKWTARAVGLHSSPMITDGKVLTMDTSGNFRVHDLQTGELLWMAEIGGGWSTTTAAIHPASGTVITATASSEVIAFDLAAQEEKWRHRVGESAFRMAGYSPQHRTVFSSPTIIGDTIFIGASDGHLRALDVATGEETWSHDFGVPTVATPCPSGDRIYTAAFDGHLFCLSGGE